MSFLAVFLPSLVITILIGAFLPLTWPLARKSGWLAAFGGTALIVHVAGLAIPRAGTAAPPFSMYRPDLHAGFPSVSVPREIVIVTLRKAGP